MKLKFRFKRVSDTKKIRFGFKGNKVVEIKTFVKGRGGQFIAKKPKTRKKRGGKR